MLSSTPEINDFPICFEQTRVICRLYQILLHRETSYLLQLSDSCIRNDDELNNVEMQTDSCLRKILLNKHSPLYQVLNRTDLTSATS